MSRDVMRVACAGLLAGCVLSLLAATGCSSVSSIAVLPDAQAVCPATPSEAIGAACEVEGLRCYPEYPCGILSVTAACVCSSGRFSCTDVTDAALTSSDGSPACPPAASGETCPSAEHMANQAPCSEPGLLCQYPSSCASIPAFDQCECKAEMTADGGSSFRFECFQGSCQTSDAGVVVPEDAGSAGPDAQPDTGVSADAAPTDSRLSDSPGG
jgi:hypothetical protein